MIADVVIPPVLLYVAGCLLLSGLRGRLLKAAALLVPVAGLLLLWAMPDGSFGRIAFIGLDLVPVKVDALSRSFGTIFHLITLLGLVFSLHHKECGHYAVALLYAGAAQGVVFAGDLFSLFVCWEVLTIAATFLIAARRTTRSRGAAFRYLLVHAAGGLCLLTGIISHYGATGDIALGAMSLGAPGTLLIFLGFGLNCAWPLLHAWLVDAYPEATIAGTVFLSAFTTKSAVYVLARTFAGTEALIWIGALMAVFPVFYAIMENDLRRVLSYSLISQVGYMVVGIGIGTELAINGAVCHAWAHILYKSLLFMAMGAVLFRTGKIEATDLGGLWRTMPLTAVFYLIGAASIAAAPLFSGFITKSMLLDALVHSHKQSWVYLALLAAGAGTIFYAGIKIPYVAFFRRDAGLRPKEAPPHMLLAMGGAALLCILLGVWPALWSRIMPYPMSLHPYTAAHVLAKLQQLFFVAVGFVLLLRWKLYPFESRSINLDVDWFYRRGARLAYSLTDWFFNSLNAWSERQLGKRLPSLLARFFEEPGGHFQLAGLRLINRLAGAGPVQPEVQRRILQRSISGSYPIGVGVLLAVLFLSLMTVLFFLG